MWKTRVVLYAADALLRDREEEFAVANDTRGRIVHLGVVDAQRYHPRFNPSSRRIFPLTASHLYFRSNTRVLSKKSFTACAFPDDRRVPARETVEIFAENSGRTLLAKAGDASDSTYPLA